MQSLKLRVARAGFIVASALALVFGTAAPAGAAPQNVLNSITLTGTPITFVAVPVTVTTSAFDGNAARTSVDFNVQIVVVDASATGGGWKLNAAAPAFTGVLDTAKTLGAITATGAPTIATDVTVGSFPAIGTCIAPLCYTPANSVTYPVAISTTAAKFANAGVGTGQGVVPLKQTFAVVVPANTTAQAYTSTMTIDIASAP